MEACVLAVDDDALLLRLVELNLSKMGIKVIRAGSGKEALQKAEEEKPDLIILDIMMPQMDGYEVLRRLKENKVTREIPVLMLTAKSSHQDRERSAEMGAADYIAKPFRLEQLRAKVKELLSDIA